MGCECGCYPNGAIPVIALQFLLFCAFMLSFASMTDCRFVEANLLNGVIPPVDLPDFVPSGSNGFGFFFWQKPNGDCAYDYNDEDIYRFYIDNVLGSDWDAARVLGVLAGVFGLVLWIWSLFFICFPMVKCVRWVLACLIEMLVIFQGLTFLIMNKDWCNDFNCSFSRGGSLSVTATVLYFVCGIIPCFMKDPPSEDDYEKSVTATGVPPAEQPVDEETPDGAEEQEEEIAVTASTVPQDTVSGASDAPPMEDYQKPISQSVTNDSVEAA